MHLTTHDARPLWNVLLPDGFPLGRHHAVSHCQRRKLHVLPDASSQACYSSSSSPVNSSHLPRLRPGLRRRLATTRPNSSSKTISMRRFLSFARLAVSISIGLMPSYS